eukprot:g14085.t1
MVTESYGPSFVLQSWFKLLVSISIHRSVACFLKTLPRFASRTCQNPEKTSSRARSRIVKSDGADGAARHIARVGRQARRPEAARYRSSFARCVPISGVAPSRTPRWTRPFSTETHEFKKLLDIVAKSLYTDKEVFIRELISNASDACEKLRFLQTTQQVKDVSDAERPLQVTLSVNESERKFVIEDSGIGMTHDELIEHLGTIAKSGSLDFLQRGESDASKIIDKVEVYTKTADKEKGEKGYLWTSDGSGSFTITEVDEVPRGTKIELTLKDDATEFSKLATVKKAAQKFSSFIDFPIYVTEEGEPKPINKQEALWMKSSATEEQHLEFFRFLSGNSYGKPWYTLMYQTDAPLSIKSCFYIPDPDNAPSRMFTKDPEIGISLHSRRVMVKKHADGVIPKWLHWMKGIVDCEDMPMNSS